MSPPQLGDGLALPGTAPLLQGWGGAPSPASAGISTLLFIACLALRIGAAIPEKQIAMCDLNHRHTHAHPHPRLLLSASWAPDPSCIPLRSPVLWRPPCSHCRLLFACNGSTEGRRAGGQLQGVLRQAVGSGWSRTACLERLWGLGQREPD